MILAPTRELAMQITDEMRDIAVCHEGVRLVCLYGVQPIGKQIDALKRRPQIVVATPGRLSDHMKRRTVSLKSVRTVVLDEADRMLDMGFIHDVTRILDKIPSRQNLGMFSATISREVMDISWVYQRDPEEITVQATKENKPDILQYRLEVPSDGKVDAIAKILAHEDYDRVICFCNTKGSTERLTKFLQMRGVDAQCIHGDIPQRKREEVMQRFRDGKLRVFVATDVASRGIDVDDVDAVFNYEVPEENEYYIHRIGRTGRAKKHGVAYTLLSDFPSRLRHRQHRPQHPQHHRPSAAGRRRQRNACQQIISEYSRRTARWRFSQTIKNLLGHRYRREGYHRLAKASTPDSVSFFSGALPFSRLGRRQPATVSKPKIARKYIAGRCGAVLPEQKCPDKKDPQRILAVLSRA